MGGGMEEARGERIPRENGRRGAGTPSSPAAPAPARRPRQCVASSPPAPPNSWRNGKGNCPSGYARPSPARSTIAVSVAQSSMSLPVTGRFGASASERREEAKERASSTLAASSTLWPAAKWTQRKRRSDHPRWEAFLRSFPDWLPTKPDLSLCAVKKTRVQQQ